MIYFLSILFILIFNSSESTLESGGCKTLFVANLNFKLDKEALCAKFPSAVSVRLPTHPDTGKRKG